MYKIDDHEYCFNVCAEYGGEYGDMRATIAAVLLDREARATTLDA